ncbi:hypothetical protein C0Q70_11103 [Pomacea canaliculata]|uniref:Uncharacterized protein n=1 Tax=Pomacea canaliculata TaxID=400727 RepID=A0A2T7P513_POMCA|nr:hypothetical protein C0Q70_11103 [Pomacea canaliculata]
MCCLRRKVERPPKEENHHDRQTRKKEKEAELLTKRTLRTKNEVDGLVGADLQVVVHTALTDGHLGREDPHLREDCHNLRQDVSTGQTY